MFIWAIDLLKGGNSKRFFALFLNQPYNANILAPFPEYAHIHSMNTLIFDKHKVDICYGFR